MILKEFYKKHITAINLVFLFFLLIASTPGDFQRLNTGIDSSWTWAINWLVESEYLHGQDVSFTYGPLGFMIHPVDIGNNQSFSLYLILITQLILCLICLCYIAKSIIFPYFPVFAITYSLVCQLGLKFEYHMLFVFILLMALTVVEKRHALIGVILCGIITSVFLFMRFYLGTSSLIMMCLLFIYNILIIKNKSTINITIFFIVFIISTIAIAISTMGNMTSFFTWLGTQMQITDGYSIAMSISGSDIVLGLGLIILIMYLLYIIKMGMDKSIIIIVLIVSLIPIFSVFKHGFVRQDAHVYRFFIFMMALCSIFFLSLRNRKELLLTGALFSAFLLLSSPVLIRYSQLAFTQPSDLIIGSKGWDNIKHLICLDQKSTTSIYVNEEVVKARTLPELWLKEIKQHNSTVDVVPTELIYCAVNELNYTPNPIIYLVFVYTPMLDNLSARHFTGDKAPDYLLINFDSVDNRNTFTDAPASWYQILTNYQLKDTTPNGDLLLAQKKAPPVVAGDRKELASFTKDITEPIEIPYSQNAVFLSMDMKLSFWGNFNKLAFRIPEVYMDVCFESGRTATIRIIPENMINGILINFLPLDLTDLSHLMQGYVLDRVVRIRLGGAGLGFYTRLCSVSFIEQDMGIRKFR